MFCTVFCVDLSQEQEQEILLEEARNDLLFYTTVCDPTYIPSRLHAYIAKKLEAVERGECLRLILSTPPQVGKSREACVEFTSWCLGKRPDLKIAVCSYAQDLTLDRSRDTRRRLKDEAYQSIFQTRIASDNAGVEEWATDGGGKFKAVGVGGGLTGKPVDLLICDDLIKDFEAAHSPKILDTAWNWLHSVAFSRLHPKSAVIMIATRWSISDPIGRLIDPKRVAQIEENTEVMKGHKWDVVNLPALAHANDPLGRQEGESIFPEKFDAPFYRSIRATGLSYIWSSLYDGNPVIAGGNYIPVAQIRIVEPSEVPENMRWARGWDLAAGSKETSNETAGAACAFGPDGTMYVKDMVHGRWKWPEARGRIAQVATVERIPIGIETVAGFTAAYANLVEVLPPSIMCAQINVSKDKLTRAFPWIALVPKGKFALVRGDWNVPFLLQAERFGGQKDDEDDMIDAVTIARELLGGALQAPIPLNLNNRLARANALRRNRSLDG